MASDRRLKVTIQLKSPLIVTARQVGFVGESETYIPGRVLRGAVARIAAQEGKDLNRLFDRPDAPRFGHAYAGRKPPVGILPLTARTCKRWSGFRRDAQDDDRHGVWDTLVSQVSGDDGTEARCPRCGQGTTPWGGRPYVAIRLGGQWRYVSPTPITQRIGRTAVARERGAVADRLLYTLEVLSQVMDRDELEDSGEPLKATAKFHALVWVDGADPWPWDRWLESVHHLGGDRSRGLGWVTVEVEAEDYTGQNVANAAAALSAGTPSPPGERAPDAMSLPDRILAFNQVLYAFLSEGDERRRYWYFTLDLQSDAVLGDVRGARYQVEPADLGLPPSVERVWSLAGYTQTWGWSDAWGLPKPLLPALAAGSTFLFRVPLGDKELAREVLERSALLEREGLGQKREEGLGWVQVCTPFHLETEVRE